VEVGSQQNENCKKKKRPFVLNLTPKSLDQACIQVSAVPAKA